MSSPHLQSPVAIGGLGGSGTRVLAQILQELGYYIGPTNESLDNFWFATLIKRPKWYRHADQDDIQHALHVFEKMLFRHEKLTVRDYRYIMQAAWERLWNRYNYKHTFSQQVRSLPGIFRQAMYKPVIGPKLKWGWKEPTTHVFLEHLADRYNNIRYIHLIRNGLDMAFSSNKNQLLILGDQFGVKPPQQPDEMPKAALDFWVRANNKAIKNGAALLGPRFLKLRFETLCAHPEKTIKEILTFLDIPIRSASASMHKLKNIPKMPASVGRFRKQDLRTFPQALMEEVTALGFPVK